MIPLMGFVSCLIFWDGFVLIRTETIKVIKITRNIIRLWNLVVFLSSFELLLLECHSKTRMWNYFVEYYLGFD